MGGKAARGVAALRESCAFGTPIGKLSGPPEPASFERGLMLQQGVCRLLRKPGQGGDQIEPDGQEYDTRQPAFGSMGVVGCGHGGALKSIEHR